MHESFALREAEVAKHAEEYSDRNRFGILAVVLLAAFSPALFARVAFVRDAKGSERPFVALAVGVLVAVLAYLPFSRLIPLRDGLALSASVLLGVVVAEANLFGFHAGMPAIQSVGLLLLIFYRYSALGGALADDHAPARFEDHNKTA